MRCAQAGFAFLLLVVGPGLAQADASPSPPAPASQPATMPPTDAPSAGSTKADPYEGLDQTGTPSLPPRSPTLPPAAAMQGSKRALLRYDGRTAPTPSAGEVLIWVPRVVFFPVYVVLEYGLRWPLVKLLTLAEKHHVPQRVMSWFTFNQGRGALFPTFFYDFGLLPSFGLHFYHNDLFARGNSLSIGAAFWPGGGGWVQAAARDSFKVFRDDAGTVSVGADMNFRPDFVFNGLGPYPASNPRFFRVRQAGADVRLATLLHNLNRASAGVRYRNVRITNGKDPGVAASDSPFVADLAREVPGYGATYNLLGLDLRLDLDSRPPERETSGSGARLELFSTVGMDPGAPKMSFVRYGGVAAGFIDLSGINHVIGLQFYTELLEPIGGAEVPITERILLGGAEYLRGFLGGWFHGDSAMEVTLGYRYPVYSALDANLFLSVGNAFNGRFEQWHPKRLVMCWGIGLRTNTSREVSFDLMVAFGTNRFEQWDNDFKLDKVRVIAGINQGF
jgi:hypothetical protein